MSARLLRDIHFFESVTWNPHLKVVMDHRTGWVIEPATNEERARRKLPVPWNLEMLQREQTLPAIP